MRRSLQIQLVVAVLLAEILLAGGLLIVGRHALKEQLLTGLNSSISGRAMSVAALVRFPEDNSSRLEFIRGLVPKPLDPDRPDAYEVFGPDGKLIARSPYWPEELGDGLQLPGGFWDISAGGRELRGIRLDRVPILDEETGTPISPGTLTVFYATPTHIMRERLASTTTTIALAAIVLVIVTGIFAAIIVRRSLSPLRKLAIEAESISPQHWTFEAPPEAMSLHELRPLVESLHTMLQGLQRAFESQRDFIASAAHELKTPVAIQKSTLQLLLHHDLSNQEYKKGLQQALRDTERLEDILQRLLRLARAEQAATGAVARDLKSVPLNESCEMAVLHMRPYAESRGVILQFVPDGNASVKADPEDLQIIWSNLLENAVRYSSSQQAVTLQISASSSNARVTVTDHGSGISKEQQARIFERFYRGDQSRARDTGGFGLGLAMVKALVEGYGGTVSVQSEPNQGSAFEVTLPAQ